MEKATSHYNPDLHLGSIRISPLQFNSLRHIATQHTNGSLNLDEISLLKQTQLRSFKIKEWITETSNGYGIAITRDGLRALKAFDSNDEYYRKAARMSFTSILKLRLPDEDLKPVKKQVQTAVTTMPKRRGRPRKVA